MPTDQETITLLWSVLKQLPKSGIDFNLVAADLGIDKPHTAYCRWNAFCKANGDGASPASTAPKAAKKGRAKAQVKRTNKSKSGGGMPVQVKGENANEDGDIVTEEDGAEVGAVKGEETDRAMRKKRRIDEMLAGEEVDGAMFA